MNIALAEHIPILEHSLKQKLHSFPFSSRIHLERATQGKEYDLILSDLDYLSDSWRFSSDLFLVPGRVGNRRFSVEGTVLTGGMNPADPVTFSSIGEDRAMLCLQQEIPFAGRNIGPFEKPIEFDRNFSLYKNLAMGFALALAEIWFGEE